MKSRHMAVLIAVLVLTLAAFRWFNASSLDTWIEQPSATAPAQSKDSGSSPATSRLERRARAVRESRATPRPPSLREQLRLGSYEAMRDAFKPDRESLERYLDANGRQPGSLLAAFNAGGDTNHLHEAAERFPGDPRVQLAVLSRNLLPEKRREWLDAFQATAGNNSLPDYFSALDHLKQGRTEQMLADLERAAAKSRFTDHYQASLLDLEEAYLAGGASVVDAKLLSLMELQLPHLHPLRELGRELAAQYERYQAAGDVPAMQQVARYGEKLGMDVSGQQPSPLITELVGIAIEKGMLKHMDDATAQAVLGMSVGERLAQLDESREFIRSVSQLPGPWDPASAMSDAEVVAYLERVKLLGEKDAIQWLQSRATPPR